MKEQRKKLILFISMILVVILTACSGGHKTNNQTTDTVPVLHEIESEKTETVPGLNEIESEKTEAVPDLNETEKTESDQEETIDVDGIYTKCEDVALYIHVYGDLPKNFITKKEARKLGWPGGGLDDYADGKCIGGDHFGNNEGLLPEKKGRRYYECDIDTLHKNKRGAKRIIYSDDGLVYYTSDHYESYTLLYGEP